MKVKAQRTRLVLVRPPHPLTTALLWFFCAAAVVLTSWIAGSGLQVDCARARGNCLVRTPGGDRLELVQGQVQAVSVARDMAAPFPKKSLVVTTREGNIELASEPLVREGQIEDAADLLDGFFRRRTEVVFATYRNWFLALESGAPFALVAVLLWIFRRRRFKVTLQWTGEDLKVKRQTLLSTAHAPALPKAPVVHEERTKDTRRLVLQLPDGRSFPLSHWTTDEKELTELRAQVERFVRADARQ